MSLPATDNFTGTDGAAIPSRTTTTGSLVWANAGGTNTCQINTNRFYGGGSGGTCLLNIGVSDLKMSMVPRAGGQFNIMPFRSNSGGTVKLEAWFVSGAVKLFDETLTQIGSTGTATIISGDTVSVEANGSAVTLKVNGTATVTTTTSHALTNIYCGIRDGVGGELYDDFSVDQFAAALPTAVLTRANTTQAILAGTSGSGGTGPYTYQWQRSTAPASGFANLSNGSGVSGGTTLTLTDGSSGIAGGTRYYYRLVVTDSLSATFTSNVQGAGAWKRPAYVLGIGDSVMAGFGGTTDPLTQFAISVKKSANGERDTIIFNAAEGGTKASDWFNALVDGETATAQSGSTGTTIKLALTASSVDDYYKDNKITITSGLGSGQTRYGTGGYVGSTRVLTVDTAWATTPDNTSVYQFSGVKKRLDTASANGISAGCTHGMPNLGINDAYSAETTAQYQANMAGICSTLLAAGYTAVILTYPNGIPEDGTGALAKLISLTANIDALINGTTILKGDTLALNYFLDHRDTELQSAGTSVHPNDVGYRSLGEMWGWGWARAVGDVTTGGGLLAQRGFGGGFPG